jgi:hypothetical protein
MPPLYIVTEEVWSISSKANERRLLSSSARPLYSGCRKLVAFSYARQLASEFRYYGVHEEGDQVYWWGRNEGDVVNHRFVIQAAPSSFAYVRRQRRPPSRTTLGTVDDPAYRRSAGRYLVVLFV